MLFKLMCFIISILGTINTQNRIAEKGYIELGHNGDQDKPYYKILFHLPGTIADSMDEYSFVADFEVTRHEFFSIRKAIESNSFIGNTSIRDGTYYFMVNYEGIRKIFETGYLEPMKAVYKSIYATLSDTTEKKRVKDIFNQTLWRLGGNISNWQ